MHWNCCRDSRRLATAGTVRSQPSVLGELHARSSVQHRRVNFAAKTERNFSRFDFLRIAQLHFDGNGADDRHAVVVIDDALHMLDQELPLVVKRRAVLE